MLHDPVNPNASPEARKLLSYIHSISGQKTLSGQHNYPGLHSDMSERAKALTGRYPAIWGQDFGFTKDDKDGIVHRSLNLQEAIRRHREGSIITLMWHAVRPMDDEPNGWKESVQAKLTDKEWEELIKRGTVLHRRWIEQLDVVAGHLAVLRDAKVPVLWRPYHEMNGDWFWWGHRPGPKGTQALHRLMFEHFTKRRRLDNLLWVWNANKVNDGGKGTGAYKDHYPGHDVVDILATDIYGGDYQDRHYEELLQVAEGRPIALGEIGEVPAPCVLERQPLWAWFMVWSDFLDRANTWADIRALYGSPRVLSREGTKGPGEEGIGGD